VEAAVEDNQETDSTQEEEANQEEEVNQEEAEIITIQEDTDK